MQWARTICLPGLRRGGAAGSILFAFFASAFAGDAPLSQPDGGQLSYALRHGTSSFVVRLAPPDGHRSITFVNENLEAEGKFAIAVADRPLPAESTLWSKVEGTIPFRHKRIFNLSLVGIEANYVRLTFEVTGPARIATR